MNRLIGPLSLLLIASATGVPTLVAAYGDLPAAFEPNRGQATQNYQYLVRSAGYSLSLAPTEAAITVRDASIRITFPNQGEPVIEALDALPGRSNYYFGQDRSRWIHGVPHFARVRYRNLWPGIDLIFYGKRGQNEYDFVVHPGADPALIAFSLDGPRKLRIDQNGNLILEVKGGQLTHLAPVIYQESNGRREKVAGRYRVTGRTVRFEVARYDRKRALVIDPVLTYSTFLGGTSSDQANGIAVDSGGNAFTIGTTSSTGFPTQAAHQGTLGGQSDVFVTKLNAQGTALLYSTFLGGASSEMGSAIAVDALGNAYITGAASSAFPTTTGVYQRTFGGGTYDAFAAKLNSTGTLVYSTLLGGASDDSGTGIAVDASGNAYVTGSTTSVNFPTTSGAYDTTYPNYNSGFVTKLNATGTGLTYSTYLDYGTPRGIAINTAGEVYVAGNANSGYPTTIGAYLISSGSGFVTKIVSSGAALVYSTLISNQVAGVAIDTGGNAYLAEGSQYSNGASVSKVNSSGTAVPLKLLVDPGYGSLFSAVALDGSGNIYLGGTMNYRAGVARLTPAGAVASFQMLAPDTSSVLALAVDSTGAVYVAGSASSAQFSTTNGAYDTTFNGNSDAFVTKLDMSDTVTSTVTVDTRPQGLSISVDGTAGNSPRTFNWPPAQAHAISVTTPQPGPTGTRYRFSSWSSYASGTEIIFTPTISGSNQLIAYFTPQYQVALTANPLLGGTVSSYNLNSGWTDAGTITVNAYPSPGYRFSSWGGDFATFNQNSTYANLNIDKAGSIIANFLTCQPAPVAAIILGPDNYSSSVSINADSACAWSANVSSSWVTGNVENASGNGSIYLSYQNLSASVPRTATMQLSGGVSVNIVQKQPTAAWRDSAGGIVVGTRNTIAAPTLPAGFASDVAATQTFGGDTIVVARDNFGGLYALRFDGTSQTWGSAWFLGGSAIGTPAITMTANGTAVMAIRDSWNSYWLRTIDPANGTGTWTHLGGVLSTDPAIAAGPGTSVYVVGKDNWNGIWTNRYVLGTGAQGWRFGGGIIKGAPSITVASDDIAYIAVRDNSDSVWMGRVQQETWLPWKWAAGIVAADPQINLTGTTVRIVSIDGTGNIFYRPWYTYSSSFDSWYQRWAALQDFSLCSVGTNSFVTGRVRTTGVVEWYGIDGYSSNYSTGVAAARPVSCGPR